MRSSWLSQTKSSVAASLGLTHAEDEFEDGETRSSDLAELGLTQELFDGKLTLRLAEIEVDSSKRPNVNLAGWTCW